MFCPIWRGLASGVFYKTGAGLGGIEPPRARFGSAWPALRADFCAGFWSIGGLMCDGWAMVDLPITDVLPQLRAAIAARGMAVLQAPPGAGKTTLVPLDLLASGLIAGRIVMLEPRRLAARAAAERMAETLSLIHI